MRINWENYFRIIFAVLIIAFGGVVMLGKRTSKFGKKKFSEWIEFLHAEAAEQGVVVYPAPVKAAA